MTTGFNDRPRSNDRDFSPQVDWYNIRASKFEKAAFINSFDLNNLNYKDVYVYSPKPDVNTDLKCIFVNKEKGIIKYELLNGTIWVLK